MKEELEKKLFKEFPSFFPSGRKVDPKYNLMCFGFSCRDGWYQLIRDLCVSIQNMNPRTGFHVVQVKEKFGGLRFYVTPATHKIFDRIHEVEEESFHICEVCGKPGKLRNKIPWWQTLCDTHLQEYYDTYEDRMKEKIQKLKQIARDVKVKNG